MCITKNLPASGSGSTPSALKKTGITVKGSFKCTEYKESVAFFRGFLQFFYDRIAAFIISQRFFFFEFLSIADVFCEIFILLRRNASF